jgi:protein TonB
MFQLRTTIGLSVFVLAVGVVGTAWLSTKTSDWQGPPARAVAHADKVRAVLRRRTRSTRPNEHAVARASTTQPAALSAADLPTLIPIEMPTPATSPFGRTVLANGHVVLHVHIDGEGRAIQANVAQTSGDAGLDGRAVRMALGWRFAVPMDHPDGLRGALVMHFESGTASL